MRNAHSINELVGQLKLRRVPFFLVFFLVILLTYSFLYAIDFIPEPVSEDNASSTEVATSTLENNDTSNTSNEGLRVLPPATVAPQPERIIFDTLNGKAVEVLNPTSDDYSVLDQALLSGVVHHPDSADFANPGNIFILGHSSYLPNVINKNFQAFNGIQKLTWGDTIRLQSADHEYVYQVEKVYQTSASEAVVPATPGEARLTLATCDVFGAKEDRFVVEAKLMSERVL